MVTPLFFMIVLGSVEIARFMYFRQAIDQATYEACRMGVITGARINTVRNTANDMLAAYGITDAAVSITPSSIDEDTETVTVTITANFAANSWVTPEYLPIGNTISTVTLDHENQAYLVPAGTADNDTLNNNDEPLDV